MVEKCQLGTIQRVARKEGKLSGLIMFVFPVCPSVSQSVSQFACLKLKNAELILTAPYTPFVTPDGKIETRYNNNKVADEGTCELIIRGCQKRLCCHVPTMVTKGRQSYEDTNCANDNSPLW